MAQAVRVTEEGLEASRRQHARQDEERAALQGKDADPEAAEEEGSQMGELLGMKGDEPEVEQGLHMEAVWRKVSGVQGEGTAEPAVQQVVVNGTTDMDPRPIKTHTVKTRSLDSLHAFWGKTQVAPGDHRVMTSVATFDHHGATCNKQWPI